MFNKKTNADSGKRIFIEWFRAVILRRPTTFVAGYDAIIPFGRPVVDEDALWQEVCTKIDALAACGALDDAHFDVVDRLVHEVVRQKRANILESAKEETDTTYRHLWAQGKEHKSRLELKIAQQQRRLELATKQYDDAWSSLSGLDLPRAVDATGERSQLATIEEVWDEYLANQQNPMTPTGTEASNNGQTQVENGRVAGQLANTVDYSGQI